MWGPLKNGTQKSCTHVDSLKWQEYTTFSRLTGTPPDRNGDVAQLGERSVRNAEVRGSIPLISTRDHKVPMISRNHRHLLLPFPKRRLTAYPPRADNGEPFDCHTHSTRTEPSQTGVRDTETAMQPPHAATAPSRGRTRAAQAGEAGASSSNPRSHSRAR